jgi:phage terminase Nu1 subunit (DNA packaging protein)
MAPSAIKAAAAVGVNQRTLYEWIAQGCPGKTTRGYDIEAIREWGQENKGLGEEEEGRGDHARLKKAQADKEELRVKLTALELEIKDGQYLPLDEVKERDLARIAVVKRGLLSIPTAVAGRVVGLQQKEIEVILRKAVRDLLEKFSRM